MDERSALIDPVDPATDSAPWTWKSCRKLFFETVKATPVVLTLCLLPWSYYTYVSFACCHVVASLEVRAVHLLVFHVLFFLLVWSYFKTVFTRPTGPPPEFRLPDEVCDEINRDGSYWQKDILLDFAEKLPIVTSKVTRYNETEIRFCLKCRTVKPDRAHHCVICGKCVLKMDHHCVLLNTCVSHSNYKFFVLFMTYGLAIGLYVISTTAQHVIGSWSVDPKNEQRHHHKPIILLFFVATLCLIVTSIMLTFHFYLIPKNRTSIETHYAPHFAHGYDENGFDLGCFRNIQEVFGKQVILWPFPINTRFNTYTRNDRHVKTITEHDRKTTKSHYSKE